MKTLAATPIAGIPYAVMILSVLGGLASAAIVGLVNGLLISRIGLSPFVTTLGTLSICRGICYVVTQGRGQAPAGPQVDVFYSLTDGKLFGLPVPLVYLLILAIVMGVALRHSRWGRYVFVLGGNEKAAALTGVPVVRIKTSVYMLCALSAGFAGILITGWLGSAPANLATGYELKIIAASVIGGADLAGGVGGSGRRDHRRSADRGDPQRPRAVRRRHLLGAGVRRHDHHPGGAGRPHSHPRAGIGALHLQRFRRGVVRRAIRT